MTGNVSASRRAPRTWKSRLRSLLFSIAIIYGSIALMLALLQRSLIYAQTRVGTVTPRDAGSLAGRIHPLIVKTHDQLELNGWYLSPGDAAEDVPWDRRLADKGPVIIFFQGNGGYRGYRTTNFKLLMDLGAHVIVFDYRGYGENPGKPSEQALAADAMAIWNFVTGECHVDPARIVLYGESLGGGVATRLAADVCRQGTPPGGLVLCATFSSLVDAASYHYPWLPVGMLLIDRFPSHEVIADVTCPILQLHGERDTIVPYRLGRKLFDAAPKSSTSGIPKRFVPLPEADHNDILDTSRGEYREALQQFLARRNSTESLRAD